VVLPCVAHALSNLIKHAAKNFVWIDKAYSACCTISEKLIAAPKLRTVLQEIQEEEYN
jgi:nanoRNase/pAp phosphatase (c-di-AMP/oligoRNAs hydrolase)